MRGMEGGGWGDIGSPTRGMGRDYIRERKSWMQISLTQIFQPRYCISAMRGVTRMSF